MEWTGIALLLLVGVGIIGTGLPATVVLVAVALFGAALGWATGTVPVGLLWALPGRLINLLDNDLLQALPLYVTMGLLLNRLPLAEALYRACSAVLPRSPSAPLVSGMVLGALLGPMNGSVGASVLGLSRVISPRLNAEGISPPTRDAVIAVASTLGVLVPPSLVLILLSDTMLSAHTLAVTQTGRADRVVNTQDIFHAALLPAGIFLVLCVALSSYRTQGSANGQAGAVDGESRADRGLLIGGAFAATRGCCCRVFLRGGSSRDGCLHFARQWIADETTGLHRLARCFLRCDRNHRCAFFPAGRRDHVHARAANPWYGPAGQ